MLITFGNIKGGVGKSTMCWHVGIALAMRGTTVIWADANPRQRSLRKLQANAIGCNPDGVAAGIRLELLENNVGRSLIDLEMANPGSVVICDVPGYDCPALRETMLISDQFIIPTPPSQLALQDLPDIIGMAGEVKTAHGRQPPLRTLINLANTNPAVKDWERAIEALESSPALTDAAPRLPLVIYNRAAFSESIEHGMGVTEYTRVKVSAQKAADEIAALIELIAGANS